MNRLKAFFTLLLFATLSVSAQVFPVRTITTVSSPYPASLDQYANTETGNLSLTIIPTDASLVDYPVKLRLTISGGWFKIYTNPSFVHKSITLNHGESLVLSAADLAQWFNPDNLIFEGYSKAQYQKTGRLPEGVYQVWFEVWDYYRNFNISGTSKAMIWSYENEAPVLNFPQNATLLTPTDPQNIVFNWTQKQSPYSSAGAGNTFTYELWEIWPDNMNVDEAVTTTKPIYTTTTNATTLNYTAAEPILITGRKYAWRVKVTDELGRSQFKNNGYSAVQWFRFGKDCSVTKPTLDKATTSSLAVKWDNNTNVDRYELRWRNRDIENGNWYTKEVTSPSATAENLSANTKYELQIKGYCGVQESSYSSSLNATTAEDVACACGNAASQTTISATTLLSSLKKGDVIRAGDFNVLVASASGSGGTFSGKGYVLVPYLKFLRFEVTFSGIQLNTNHQLTSGEIHFVYNEKNGLVLNVSAVINALFSSNDSKPVETNTYVNTADKKIVSDTTVKSITINAAGDVVVTRVTGAQQVVHTSSGELVAVSSSDGTGEQSVVDTKTKTVYKGTADTKGSSGGSSSPIQPVTSDSAQYKVDFVAHSQQKCGLDLPSDSHPSGNYNSVSIGGKDYLIPWKSVESGTIDYLEASVTGGPADSIHFVTGKGNLVLTAPGSSLTNPAATSKQLLVSGADASDELKAWYAQYETANGDSVATQKRILAGQVNVVSYSKTTHNLVLVQVNGAASPDVATVKDYINKTYNPALQEFNISKIDNFKVDFSSYGSTFDNTHDDAALGMFTDPEQAVIETFISSPNYDPSSYYLFFIGDIATTDQSLYGYMPFNQHFGFVYRDNPSADRLMHTLVHEPGHGVFGLRHTFSAYNQFMQDENSTLNVMDYPSSGKELTSNELLKYQWDLTHNNTQEYSDTESENEIEERGTLTCGCSEDYFPNQLNGDCKAIIDKINSIKIAFKKKQNILLYKTDLLSGHVNIEGECIDRLYFDMSFTKTSSVTFDPASHSSSPVKVRSYDSNQEYWAIVYEGILQIKIPIPNPDKDTDVKKRILAIEKYMFGVNEVNNNISISQLAYSSGREYGWLSAEQESGTGGGCNLGYDDGGGCSYGKYQIAARTGTLMKFIDWVNSKTSNKYNFFTNEKVQKAISATSKAKCQLCELTKKWMEQCGDDEFNKWQYTYILETHYNPVYSKIINTFGNTNLFKNMSSTDEEALKEMCISLGVQHGGAFRIFEMALLNDYTGCSDAEILDKNDSGCSAQSSDFPTANNKNSTLLTKMKATANNINMSEFIDRVYAARKLYIKAKNVDGWKSIVEKRYKKESRKLKDVLGI